MSRQFTRDNFISWNKTIKKVPLYSEKAMKSENVIFLVNVKKHSLHMHDGISNKLYINKEIVAFLSVKKKKEKSNLVWF